MDLSTRALMTACAGLIAVSAISESAQVRPQTEGLSDCRQALVDRFVELSGDVMADDDGVISRLVLLREELKLARDVYLTFTALYDVQVFPTIALSEQSGMDLVAMILERYGIEDPAAGKGIGKFESPRLQDLFDDLLVPMGEASLVGALSAGAIIEDLDIFRLENLLVESTFPDVNLFVENIVADSRDHLRQFVGALEQRGETYFPPFYIGKDSLALILGSETETAVVYDEYGDVFAECQRGVESGNRS